MPAAAHIGGHGRQAFVGANVTGVLTVAEEAAAAGVGSFVYTSTTSVFGRALSPPPGAPAAWITEEVAPVPRNLYGVTKAAAEDVCELIHRDHGLPVAALRPQPARRAVGAKGYHAVSTGPYTQR